MIIEPWVALTIMAALAQTARFSLQRHLKKTKLTSVGTTFARFVFSMPVIIALMVIYVATGDQIVPATSAQFWAYSVAGGLAQILATICLMSLFAQRNFAVGVTLIKTEVVLSVLVGLVLLGEGVSTGGMAAIAVGLAGVLLLSDPPGGEGAWHRRIWNKAAGLGILAGLLFAISAVGYRGATLALSDGTALMRGGYTLAIVTVFQTLIMAVWLLLRDPGEIARVFSAWRITALVGVTGMIGSLGWFTAFALQTAAYVKALGQIEVAFVLAVSVFVFGERMTRREGMGLVLLTASVVILVLVT